ncbi:efflux RND transporter periplasmic adaptor subunit [Ginsengibacter hankyongi]|nr:efflux RND transporter periplasmic adaptor subunit [Ginsengibacter hankyongi]
MKNIIPFFIATTLVLFACKAKVETVAVKDPPIISDSLGQIIKIDTAKNEYIEDQLSLSGEVSYDDNNVVKIFPNASGQVMSVNVSLGDKVKKGQTLAVIKSADVAGNYADLSTVNSDAAIAEKEYKNAEELYKNGISSEKDFVQAKLEYDKAMNAVKKVQMQIEINGGGKTKAGGAYFITAPRDGFIVEKNINAGSFIRNDNNQDLFTISDMKDVWVLANVFETDIPKIKVGQPAEVTTLAYPGKVFYGKVDQINSVLDPMSKAMKIKIVLPNTNMLLKPEMFTSIMLAKAESQKALEIPSTAIISDGGKNYVVTYKDRYHVRAQEVNILKVSGTKTYITGGINEGDLVISKNQILIYNSLIEE